MTFTIKKKYLRRGIFLSIAALLLFGGWQVFDSEAGMPEAFTKARLEGSRIGADIVDIIEDSHQYFRSIADYDRVGDYRAALDVSANALEANDRISLKASELAGQLEVMTENLPTIYPVEARTEAQNAIITEIQLINKLIVYSNLQQQLLEALRAELSAQLYGTASPDVAVQDQVENINAEVREINALNQQFKAHMTAFDAYFVE